MNLEFSTLDESATNEIIRWRYEPPYDIYNIEATKNSIQYALDPRNNFFAIRDKNNELVGFCSFGQDAQVPGGDYIEDALDIGLGIRPDLTGKGFGSDFVEAVIKFARKEFSPQQFRVTIATFNQRAQRVWIKNGFRLAQTFTHKITNQEFLILNRYV